MVRCCDAPKKWTQTTHDETRKSQITGALQKASGIKFCQASRHRPPKAPKAMPGHEITSGRAWNASIALSSNDTAMAGSGRATGKADCRLFGFIFGADLRAGREGWFHFVPIGWLEHHQPPSAIGVRIGEAGFVDQFIIDRND